MNAEERFDQLVGQFEGEPQVTLPAAGPSFGSSALKANGRIFAMLSHGRLVVKLPRDRVEQLVVAGDGVRFDANKGTPMREWLSVDPASPVHWEELAREALHHVCSA